MKLLNKIFIVIVLILLILITLYNAYKPQNEPKVTPEEINKLFNESNSMACDIQNGTPFCNKGTCEEINGTYWCMPNR